jgi:hypothetical protein
MAAIDVGHLEGGAALCAWYGTTPSFHDAKLSKLGRRQYGHVGGRNLLACRSVENHVGRRTAREPLFAGPRWLSSPRRRLAQRVLFE